ncbi:MAG: YqgE/AlgH family protein [Steroidobacteraceae bacterium]
MSTSGSLANQLLVAMPQLADPNFSQSVTLICDHSPDQGALGIVVNRPLSMSMREVFAQLKVECTDDNRSELPVLLGGPVQQDRGFVIHRPGGEWDASHSVSPDIQITTSRDILAAIATGQGPRDAFLALGYAGWQAGQLEREMLDNAWICAPVDARVLFDLPYAERWSASWRLLGIDPLRMSLQHGHA